MAQRDAAFFTHTSGSDLIWQSDDKSVRVYKNGEMRIHYGDNVLRYSSDLYEYGIDSDEKLNAMEESGEIEWVDNPWFEIVWDENEDGEVHHDIIHAIERASAIAKSKK
jgi:hypothetical protein